MYLKNQKIQNQKLKLKLNNMSYTPFKMKGPALYGKAMGKSPVENETGNKEVDAQQKTYEKMWTDSSQYKNLKKANAPSSAMAAAKAKWSGANS